MFVFKQSNAIHHKTIWQISKKKKKCNFTTVPYFTKLTCPHLLIQCCSIHFVQKYAWLGFFLNVELSISTNCSCRENIRKIDRKDLWHNWVTCIYTTSMVYITCASLCHLHYLSWCTGWRESIIHSQNKVVSISNEIWNSFQA